MKRGLIIVFFLSFLRTYSQEEIQLSVKWNTLLSRYDVFMKPNFSASKIDLSISITIVVPTGSPTGFFQIISHHSIGLSQDIPFIAPSAAPNSDFHVLYSNSFRIGLIQNQETIVCSFKFLDGKCREGIRLFNNDSDPDSKTPGMKGNDFRNSIINAIQYAETYSSNYNNNGTICSDCTEKVVLPFIIQKNKTIRNLK